MEEEEFEEKIEQNKDEPINNGQECMEKEEVHYVILNLPSSDIEEVKFNNDTAPSERFMSEEPPSKELKQIDFSKSEKDFVLPQIDPSADKREGDTFSKTEIVNDPTSSIESQ